jgi:lysophospholipase L1-like esterase
MKEVLCFGDSNTWGFDPRTKERYARTTRWTCLLQEQMGEKFAIVDEGLNGRTTVWDDPVEGDKNGLKHLGPCIESHKPLDLVVIMLGTNDLKQRYSVPAVDIARSVGRLVEMVQKSTTGIGGAAPPVLLVSPPPLAKLTEFADMFAGGGPKSQKLAELYRTKAEELGCLFLDAGSVVQTSGADGVHWEPEGHARFAGLIGTEIKKILA